MNGYCNRGDLRRSLGLLEDMRSRKLAPNAVIYNTLLKGYAHKADIEGLKRVCGTVLKKGTSPFTLVIRFMSKQLISVRERSTGILVKEGSFAISAQELVRQTQNVFESVTLTRRTPRRWESPLRHQTQKE